jgi:hypothetical protein
MVRAVILCHEQIPQGHSFDFTTDEVRVYCWPFGKQKCLPN